MIPFYFLGIAITLVMTRSDLSIGRVHGRSEEGIVGRSICARVPSSYAAGCANYESSRLVTRRGCRPRLFIQ